MTKEEILKDILKHGGMCAYYDGDVYDGEAGSLHEGMDIYAKQQSIEFKKWCDENKYKKYGTGDWYFIDGEQPIAGKQFYSTLSELHSLFIQQIEVK